VSELPGRPNLDQLRRQARELLRAAADGQPSALTRIRAISERVSLSAAQLAVAREYGFASWPALHAEVQRRLAELPPGEEGSRRAGTRWSFGGAAAIETTAGRLFPGGLVAGPGHAVLDASVMPSDETLHLPTRPPGDKNAQRARRVATGNALSALQAALTGSVALTDDQGMTYALSPAMTISIGPEGGLVSLHLEVDPVPARERRWLELRGQEGSAARLLPSTQPDTRVGGLTPVVDSPAARELSGLALMLIGLRLTAQDDDVELQCSAALARAAEIQRSGEPGVAGNLPGQLAQLCAFLTGQGPADGLTPEWSSMISATNGTDGAQQHLDIAAALPDVDGIWVRVDSLVSEPETWKLYLRTERGWWTYSNDPNRRWAAMAVHAEDNLGGIYLSQFDSSSSHDDHEELTLRFLPRLNPLARTLTLRFRRAAEQVTIELRLP
jgi:hypothetical protein